MVGGKRGEGSVSDGAGDEDLGGGRGVFFSFDWKERMRCKICQSADFQLRDKGFQGTAK